MHYSVLDHYFTKSNLFPNPNYFILVGLPDFPGQQWRTHSDTYEEAFKNGLEVMEELYLAGVHGGIDLPEAKTAESLEFQSV